jgi:hypothetical protein
MSRAERNPPGAGTMPVPWAHQAQLKARLRDRRPKQRSRTGAETAVAVPVQRRLRLAGGVLLALFAITAANYSFISFGMDGSERIIGALKPIAFLRLPLALLGCLLLTLGWPSATRAPMSLLGPVLGIVVLSFVAAAFALDTRTALVYGLWWGATVAFLALYAQRRIDAYGEAAAARALAWPILVFAGWFLLLAVLALPRFQLGQAMPGAFTTEAKIAIVAPFFLGAVAVGAGEVQRKAVPRLLVIGLGVFTLLLIAVSGKRMAMIAALIIAAAWLVLHMQASIKLVAVLIIPAALVALVAAPALRTVAVEATEHSTHRIEKGMDAATATSINARKQVWETVLAQTEKRPLGIGFANGALLVGAGLHNSYLGYWLETGVLGAMMVASLVLAGVATGLKTTSPAKREILFFLFIPAALFHVTEYNTSPGQILFLPFWTALAFLLAKRNPARRAQRTAGQRRR